MIEFRQVEKRFGARAVLRGVDLAVARGRTTAIVGPNGAGKTTLIKSLLGLTRTDAGDILFDGAPVAGRDDHRARIGYMPQIARFPESLTGAHLLALAADLRGVPAPRDALVDAFALDDALARPLRVLSGGTRQKVNAVLALSFAPALLVLDEPTAGLDPVSSGILKDRVAAERDAGRTVIITSHVMSELDELCDDVAFLMDGRVHFAGAIEDLKRRTRQATLERAIASLMIRRVAA
jgi:Cu-processing system ATP-binding protein